MAAHTIDRIPQGRSFHYAHKGEVITDKSQLAYYRSLGIPPAWKNVSIAINKRNKILATGTDKAGRTQYIYNPRFRAKQEQAKFERILRFARVLPKMRKTVDQDLKRTDLDYQKVMACIVSIMDQTYIRVGNDSYARDNGSYGLTTLRSKHTRVRGSTITFDFQGKSGKHHLKHLEDKHLAKIVKQLDALPGYEIFKYYDEVAKLHDVKSADVNDYIKTIMGEEFSAKDFRTWAGTLTASMELMSAERSHSRRERQKTITACVNKVAKKLGNTPAIARSSYIDPRIIKLFMDSNDLSKVRDTVLAMKHKQGSHYLSPDERCVLTILEV